MTDPNNKDYSNNNDDGDEDETDEKAVQLLLRRRAVAAAAKLLLHNGIDDPWAVDDLLDREEDYFNYKMRRNVRREKLQTVLKLFGFRSIVQEDVETGGHLLVENVPEKPEQIYESKVVSFFEKYAYRWSLLVALVQAYYLIVVPFRCCFSVPRGIASVVCEALFCDLIMYLNIIVRIYQPKEVGGVLRWNGKNDEYFLKFWFWFDLVANFPMDYVGLILGHNCTLSFNRCDLLAPYWQLNRCLNVHGFIDTTLETIELILQRLHIHPYAALVVVVTMVQTYFWHLFACFLFLDVIRKQEGFEIIRQVRVNDTDIPLIQADIPLQYAASLDWSSKVLAGWDRGSTFPSDNITFFYNAASVIVGICIMTTFVSFVSGLVEMVTPYITQTMEIDEIIEISKYKKIEPELQREMTYDSWYRYDNKTHMLQASEVLGDLPEVLHDKLLLFEGKRVLGRVTLFAPLLKNESFVISVAKLLKPLIMAPREVLFEKGDAGESMYFVVEGKLGVVADDDYSKVKFELKSGAFVGEIALLLGASRTATVVCLDNFAKTLSLNKKDFESLKRRFPNTFAQIHQKARDRWLELNQGMLEKAKELGKKEIEEIARKRFKLAAMKIQAAEAAADDGNIHPDGGSPNNNNNNNALAQVILQAQIKDSEARRRESQRAEEESAQKRAATNLVHAMFGSKATTATATASPTAKSNDTESVHQHQHQSSSIQQDHLNNNPFDSNAANANANESFTGMQNMRTTSSEAEAPLFGRPQRRDSQNAFMRQFLKDTMEAQSIEVAIENHNRNDDDDDDHDVYHHQSTTAASRGNNNRPIAHQQHNNNNNNNNNTTATLTPQNQHLNNGASDNSVFQNTTTAEREDHQDQEEEEGDEAVVYVDDDDDENQPREQDAEEEHDSLNLTSNANIANAMMMGGDNDDADVMMPRQTQQEDQISPRRM